MRKSLASVRLLKPFFDFCQKIKPFHRVFKGRIFGKILDGLESLLLYGHVSIITRLCPEFNTRIEATSLSSV